HLRASQAKYLELRSFNHERFKLGLHDVSKGQYENLLRGQREIIPSMTVALPSELHPPLWEGVHLVRCTLYLSRSRVYADRVCLPDYVDCPGDRVRIMPNSVTCPIPFSSRGREPSSSGGGCGSASWTPAMLDFWCHKLELAPTFCELFERTHKRKGTDDYVSKSARTIAVSQ
ncbi:hypothetical protein Taro_008720, partial [Colocasia esculenta]|nr:hypothetical protein [Colocasia esculenta]